ncbi:hypothetical protein D9758_010194 [Tetrapyrgos nigripes]|uniref:Extracellular mutant protein 11 C-terminal domain-containing protein n=1 Tax=Tetrapyrgos nigripes TaxID=182062 RepID=A0A8H5CXH2_9AGAR|nr:hypothetical protein D9758_010194 [Tetrapyrgos nigripes]
MSARTPFIPSNASRPPSRATHQNDQNASSQFMPDRSNPLHVKPTSDPIASTPQKPLNINGLIKKTPKPGVSANGMTRKPNGPSLRGGSDASGKAPAAGDQSFTPNALIRSRNPNANSGANNHNSNASPVIAPTPINAAARAASPLFRNNVAGNAYSVTGASPNASFDTLKSPISAFKAPSAPGSTSGNHDDAHIPTSDTQSVLNSSTSGSFKLKVSHTNPSGPPLRVPITTGEDSQTHFVSGTLPMSGLLRQSNGKRSRTEFEAGQDDEIDEMLMYVGHCGRDQDGPMLKRYKAQVQPKEQRDEIEEIDSTRPSLSPISPVLPDRSLSSPVDQLDRLGHPRARTRSLHAHSDVEYEHNSPVQDMYANHVHHLGPSHSHGRSRGNDRGFEAQHHGVSSLDKLLACDASAYVDDHMERYEQMANKWKQCRMEEWVKGADEIMAKYSKIMDFVKDHMSKKLALFASFDAHVETHNGVLDERKRLLEAAKKKLVEGGGSMIQG